MQPRTVRPATRQLALSTVAFAISFALWGLISALAPHFKTLYHLTPTEKALMIAVPVILGSLFRVPMGALTDRFGGRKVFRVLPAFGIVPAAGIASMHSYSARGFFLGLAGSSFPSSSRRDACPQSHEAPDRPRGLSPIVRAGSARESRANDRQ